MAPRGELENRDRDEGIGDLPETLGLERVELFDSGSARSNVPTDMRANAERREAAADAPLGTPGVDYDVRSIYDSRPVNSTDFNLWFEFADEEGEIDMARLRRCFAVPFGYVAVVRSITCLYTPEVVVDTNYDGFLKILVDGNNVDPIVVKVVTGTGVDVVQTSGILWQSGKPIETFTIADQEQFVGVELGLANDEVIDDRTEFQIGFYGQFLQKTQIPAQFQAANKAGTSAPKFLLPPETRGGTPEPRRTRAPYPGVPLPPRRR